MMEEESGSVPADVGDRPRGGAVEPLGPGGTRRYGDTASPTSLSAWQEVGGGRPGGLDYVAANSAGALGPTADFL